MVDDAVACVIPLRRTRSARRVPGWAVVLCVLVVASAGVAGYFPVRSRLAVRRFVAGLSDADPQVRARSCYRLASYRSEAGADAICALLPAEQDPGVCEAAAYALQKMRDPRARALLAGVIDRLPDCVSLAKIISYHARAGGPDVADQIARLSRCGQTWHEMGAGAGLLELDDVRGAQILLTYASAEDPFVREFAADFLRRVCEPMMEMIGDSVDLSTAEGSGFSEAQLDALTVWWSRKDRSRELRDSNSWSRRNDPTRHQINRLLHARERAARLIGLDE